MIGKSRHASKHAGSATRSKLTTNIHTIETNQCHMYVRSFSAGRRQKAEGSQKEETSCMCEGSRQEEGRRHKVLRRKKHHVCARILSRKKAKDTRFSAGKCHMYVRKFSAFRRAIIGRVATVSDWCWSTRTGQKTRWKMEPR